MKNKKSRASNGMGSIRQRSDGRWEARYSTPDGRQRSVYAKSEAEVTKKLRSVLHDLDSGAWMEPSRMTVGDWLDIWLRDYQGHTTGRTVETYTCVVNKRLRPMFGNIKLNNFSQIHVRRMVSQMTQEGKSPSTIKHAKGILSTAMKCAVEAGLIKSNPVQGVKSPRMVKPTITIIDRDKFQAFVDAVQKTTCADALVFMLLTGIRAGEMQGLRWADIDNGTMTINRQLHAQSKNKKKLGAPKDGEVRDIHLPAEAIELLKNHRKTQLAERLAAGDKWHDDEITTDLVFRQPDGTNLDEGVIYKAILSVREELGMPHLRPHDLRHSYAVAALRSGVDVKTVQHNLGHKHASITLDTYAAYTTDAGKVGAERFDSYWKDALKTPN